MHESMISQRPRSEFLAPNFQTLVLFTFESWWLRQCFTARAIVYIADSATSHKQPTHYHEGCMTSSCSPSICPFSNPFRAAHHSLTQDLSPSTHPPHRLRISNHHTNKHCFLSCHSGSLCTRLTFLSQLNLGICPGSVRTNINTHALKNAIPLAQRDSHPAT